MPTHAPPELLAYYKAGKPLICEIERNPFVCEFWPFDELQKWNAEYQISEFAPGYFGFATNGGGELYAIAPTGAVVCLPFIGMEPEVAWELAPDWPQFEVQLWNAP